MTWKKAAPVLIVAGLFDALKFMCEWLIIFGPALGGLLCAVKASDYIGTTAGVALCGTAAAGVGALASEVIIPLGIMLGMAVGFIGWLTIGLWLLMGNKRIFKENALWFGASLLVSEVPIVNSIPAITFVLWRMYRTQIRIEKEERKKYDEEQAALDAQEQRQQQEAYLLQARALETEHVEQQEQEAANEELY